MSVYVLTYVPHVSTKKQTKTAIEFIVTKMHPNIWPIDSKISFIHFQLAIILRNEYCRFRFRQSYWLDSPVV
jgi:hypothetical protein